MKQEGQQSQVQWCTTVTPATQDTQAGLGVQGQTGQHREFISKEHKNINKSKNEFRPGTFSLHVPMTFTLCILIPKETYSITSTVGTYRDANGRHTFKTKNQHSFLWNSTKTEAEHFRIINTNSIPADTQPLPVWYEFYQKTDRLWNRRVKGIILVMKGTQCFVHVSKSSATEMQPEPTAVGL